MAIPQGYTRTPSIGLVMQRQGRKHTRAHAHHPNRSQGLQRGARRGGHPGGRGAGGGCAGGDATGKTSLLLCYKEMRW